MYKLFLKVVVVILTNTCNSDEISYRSIIVYYSTAILLVQSCLHLVRNYYERVVY